MRVFSHKVHRVSPTRFFLCFSFLHDEFLPCMTSRSPLALLLPRVLTFILVILTCRIRACHSTSEYGDIVVGNYRYTVPFSQYGPVVSAALMQRVNQEDPAHSTGEGRLRENDTLNDAEWYLELGLAHRSVVEDKADLTILPEEVANHLQMAVNAMKQAIQVHHGLLDTNEQPRWITNHHLASLYFEVAETYSLDPERNHLAMEYLTKSAETFRSLLEEQQIPRIDPFSKTTIEINWALALVRLGTLILNNAVADTGEDVDMEALQQELVLQEGNDDGREIDISVMWEDWLSKHPEQAQRIKEAQEKLSYQIERAQGQLTKAVAILRKGVSRERDPPQQAILQGHLANALQNLGVAANLRQDIKSAVDHFEDALTIYRELTDPSSATKADNDTLFAMTETYYSLADSYLQLGEYTPSMRCYESAMGLYSKHHWEPSTASEPMSFSTNADGIIDQYEKALLEYRELISSPQSDDLLEDITAGDDLDYGYEGDIHLTLGTLYLSSGDLLSAESHLLQAISRYELAGEDKERTTADARFNLAIVYFQTRNFLQSAESRRLALEIYHDVVGEGVNPILDDNMPHLGLRLSSQAGGVKTDQSSPVASGSSSHNEIIRSSRDDGTSVDTIKATEPETTNKKVLAERTATVTGEFETIISLDALEAARRNSSGHEEL